jgi:ATPase inhibitor, mitochondrial
MSNRLATMCLRNVGNFRPMGLLGLSSSRWSSTAGSVRELGGVFGLKEAAEEDIFFRKVTAQQLEELRGHHVEEIRYHEKEMREDTAAIDRYKQKLRALKLLTHTTEPENPMNDRVD